MSVGRHVSDARFVAADVDHDEAQRAAHGGVRPPPVTEHVLPAVHIELLAYRTVDDQEVGAGMGRGLAAVEVVLRLHHGLDRRDQDRQIFGPAARHHRVDRDLLDGGDAVPRRDARDHVMRCAVRVAQHLPDRVLRRRKYRQAVGPALIAALLEELEDALEGVGDFELPGACFDAVVHVSTVDRSGPLAALPARSAPCRGARPRDATRSDGE